MIQDFALGMLNVVQSSRFVSLLDLSHARHIVAERERTAWPLRRKNVPR